MKAVAINLRMYEALKRITRYQTPSQLRRSSGKQWGLGYEEAMEYAYENIQQEAKDGLKGVRLPKLPRPSQSQRSSSNPVEPLPSEESASSELAPTSSEAEHRPGTAGQ